MSQLAVAGGGAAVGAVIGSVVPGVGTMVGAQIGWALGGIAGSLMFPEEVTNTGSTLSDLTVQTSGYGVSIPIAAGIMKLSGNVIWCEDELTPRETTTRSGKGGTTTKTVSTSYYLSWATGLCEWLTDPAPENPEILRIWFDTYLVYDSKGESEITAIPGLIWRFYPGSETQLPDQLIAAAKGAEHAPAHRGMAYIVFEDVPLETFGNRMPNVTVELVAEATRSFTQVATIDPDDPIWPSTPAAPNYISAWGCNVAVDHYRGRIYEGRSRTSGAVGNANDTMIRVYDLSSMETIGEYPMGDMVEHLFPTGVTPGTTSVGPGIMHLGVDGYLYVTGGTVNRVPLWKIDPDSWRAVDVFGNPEGNGNGFGDNGTYLINAMQMKSLQVPVLGAAPRTFVVVQGSYSTAMLIDADRMEYVWGAGDVAVGPPVVTINLGISPLSFPVQIVTGRTHDDGGVELYCLRAYGSPGRIEVARYRIYSGAANLGGGAAMGIIRDDDMTIDLVGAVDSNATDPTLQAAWYDHGDDTLVITCAGQGNMFSSYTHVSTFKWAPGGAVIWAVVDHALPSTHDGRGDMGRVLGGYWGLAGNLYLQTGSGDALVNASGTQFNNLFWLDERQAVIGFEGTGTGARPIAKRYLDRLNPVDLQLGHVQQALCLRAGMDEADIDVTELTDDLRGYVLASAASARDSSTPLAAFGQYDAAEIDDVLVFRKRGGAVVATIPFEDLIRESADQMVIEEQRAQDADLPRDLSVRYLDIERAWEQSTQRWARPASPTRMMGGNASASMDLAIPLTGDETKAIARRLLTATWRERTQISFSLGPKYLGLVPTDPIVITTRDGAEIRCRVLTVQLGANWITRIEAVTEDAAAYALTATADSGSGFVQPVIPTPYAVRLMLPDMALITDGDDMGQAGLREYALVGSYSGSNYRATAIYRSPDTAAWTELGSAVRAVTWGTLVETPGEPITPWTWDEDNTLEVRMENGDLETADAGEVLNWANLAALISSDGSAELVQFRVATDLGAGRYSLSGLLRGRRGTEDLIASRSAGNAFVLLSGAELRYGALTNEATATRYHRAVTVYDTVETVARTTVKAARGRAETPYAPCQIAGSRDGSGNLTITWARRTRYGGEWLDGTGTVPLGEASEAYEIDIHEGPPPQGRTYTGDGGLATGASYGYALAFDGVAGTEWRVSGLPRRLEVDFDAGGFAVVEYAVKTTGQLASSAPKTWVLQGWDGSSWVTVDTRSSETGWSPGLERTYTVATPGLYENYSLYVTANNGNYFTGVAELRLRTRAGGPDVAASAYAQAVVRTIEVSSPTASYSAANQTTDFGSAQAEIFISAYQISNIMGRGVAAEAIV